MKTVKILLLAVAFTFSLRITVRAEEAKAAAKDSYPLTTCVVSGEKLGEMGKPYVHTENGREVKFCCKGCLKDFKKEPAKYLKKLDEATAAAAKK